MKPETQQNTPDAARVGSTDGSAPFSAFAEARGVWPWLTHEEIFRAGWDAAIAAAVAHVKGQALTPLEIADGTKWADDATEYIADAMQRDLSTNAGDVARPGDGATSKENTL